MECAATSNYSVDNGMIPMKTTQTRLAALRRLMREHEIDAYVVPTADAHLNEYVPACWRRREWLSGFTGSAGDLVVTNKHALLWTDGRYFLQAEQQLAGSGIKLMRAGNSGVPMLDEYLRDNMKPGSKVGVDPHMFSMDAAESLRLELESGGVYLTFIDRNLVDDIWADAPDMPNAPIELVPRRRAGEVVSDKLSAIRSCMAERNADALVITTLDAIAWMFNLRGGDVEYNPVVIAYGIVTPNGATLFVDEAKLCGATRARLEKDVTVLPYDAIRAELRTLAKHKSRVWVDKLNTNQWVIRQLGQCDLITASSPIYERKARKNTAELQGTRRAHVRDGASMVRFLRWLSEESPSGNVTELSAAARLEEIRATGEDYRGPSFHTISAFGPNAAIVHYNATEQSNTTLSNGLYLIDSGGQYLDGTTDITRTVLIGNKVSARQRRIFTLVLKGHIAIARTKFPSGVRGMRLDTIARTHLWNDGLDFAHGTGHGIGVYLNVHEGPQAIHPFRCKGAFIEPGNIISNEPGCYITGEFGIRTENIVVVVKDDGLSTKEKTWLAFDTISLCPIDRRLVDTSLLSPEELAWLNDYHKRVESTLAPLLEDHADREWLTNACAPLTV